jgi:ubiquinone/menaquinone biosynthesis C-methylase UbiE
MPAHAEVVASLAPGDRVLDVACGPGVVAADAAARVQPGGEIVGVDISDRMVDAARLLAQQRQVTNVRFQRMDAEQLDFANCSFDVALCALALMYVPNPEQAVREMRRVLRPCGRMVVAVWGERQRCGWSALFPIVDAEVASEVCPLFFRLGQAEMLARLCVDAGFEVTRQRRLATIMNYANDEEACNAAFIGGPVALAWSRFDNAARARARSRYLEAIAPWRNQLGYRIPAEFVVVAASVPNPLRAEPLWWVSRDRGRSPALEPQKMEREGLEPSTPAL